MSNFVSHQITVTKPTEEMKEVLDALIDDPDSGFFQRLRPMPDAFKGTVKGYCGGVSVGDIKNDDGLQIAINKIVNNTKGSIGGIDTSAINAALQSYNAYKEFGCSNWYDWRCRNWGCKWDASDIYVTKNDDEYTVEFNTPWSTPDILWDYLVENCGDMAIEGWFYDEDIGSNCGTICINSDGASIDYVDTLDFALSCTGMSREEFADVYGYTLEELEDFN